MSPGPKHAVVALTQRPVVQVSPGQQSLLDAQVSLETRQRQYAPGAVPEAAQAIVPQQGLAPTPASPTPASPAGGSAHCVPAEAQQRRPAAPTGAQSRLLQQSVFVVQVASPRGRQVTGRRHVPITQVVPAQQSGDSAQT